MKTGRRMRKADTLTARDVNHRELQTVTRMIDLRVTIVSSRHGQTFTFYPRDDNRRFHTAHSLEEAWGYLSTCMDPGVLEAMREDVRGHITGGCACWGCPCKAG